MVKEVLLMMMFALSGEPQPANKSELSRDMTCRAVTEGVVSCTLSGEAEKGALDVAQVELERQGLAK